MDKCICWHQYPLTGRTVCWGTKEIDDCKCGGDETLCDFYPETRIKALSAMNKEILMPDKESEFEVGDIVITSTGQIGIIEDLCQCDRCEARGFYEPLVKVLVGNDAIYITDNDKRVNFRSFYKIGKHIFGNIDMDNVDYDIENENKKVQEAATRVRKYREQLHVLEKLAELKENDLNDLM